MRAFRGMALNTLIRAHLSTKKQRPLVPESNQLVAIQLVGPTEVVNNMGDGFSGGRVPLIVSKLVVFNTATVLIFSSGDSQVHNCLHQ